MKDKKKRIVIAPGGNALGNTLPEQMKAVRVTVKAIVDLIEEGYEIIAAHGNDPQVGMIDNAMATLSHGDANQPDTSLSVCVTMSRAYIGYDLQNALREELCNREMYDIPIATMIIQVRVDADDPAFEALSKPIGHFMIEGQARIAEDKYDYIMKEDSGRDFCHVVASPRSAEVIEIGATRSLVDSGQPVIAYGVGDVPVTRRGSHLKGASAVIDKDFANKPLTGNLNADSLTTLTAVKGVVISFEKPEEKRLDNLDAEGARQYIKGGHFIPDSILPKVRIAVKFTESKPGCTALITLLGKTEDGIQGRAGTHIHLV